MNYEEAIKRLNNFKNIDFIVGKDLEAIDTAINAMEMQIPKKPEEE